MLFSRQGSNATGMEMFNSDGISMVGLLWYTMISCLHVLSVWLWWIYMIYNDFLSTCIVSLVIFGYLSFIYFYIEVIRRLHALAMTGIQSLTRIGSDSIEVIGQYKCFFLSNLLSMPFLSDYARAVSFFISWYIQKCFPKRQMRTFSLQVFCSLEALIVLSQCYN